jgi:hypothetical protein
MPTEHVSEGTAKYHLAFTYRRDTFWQWRMIVVDYAEQRLHRRQLVIWRFTLKQFDDRTSYTPFMAVRRRTTVLRHEKDSPDIRGRRSAGKLDYLRRHPIRRSNHRRVAQPSCPRSNTEIRQFHQSILCGQNICTFDVAMYHTLVVQVKQTMKNLGQVYADQIFRELPKVLADAVQGTIFAVSELPVSIYPSIPSIQTRTGAYSRMM